MARRLVVRRESWPLARPFRISRGVKTHAEVVVAEISQDGVTGRAEAVPYARYGHGVDSSLADMLGVRDAVEAGAGRRELQALLAPGAARNALDCALWDLEAKLGGIPAWRLAGLEPPADLVTAYTLSLDSVEAMAAAAAAQSGRPLLKVKLDRERVIERLTAVRRAAPGARLVVDANESWSAALLRRVGADLAALGVDMVEQPLPAGEDEALAGLEVPVRLCADESCHGADDVAALADRYDMINIKLDKTGGLTGALALREAALGAGLEIMVGCMVGTSLAMAPAMLVAGGAAVTDLDGPLLMARDRRPGLVFEGSVLHPAPPELWG